ncbi:T9SS type B sorting domain-containing protein [Croceivirga thetidis]|uniref:T9SS type B sorting domain-containing protein n=1 Tax=Croceivirga thetidis TaxID=2721623 RepID=A0ABX1GS69_9FLAO|nr:T9SS type B sorting domain-containing protein [Croceivirga thetidis]NKI32795.1 T9SS type B sorting domain-containing protein [Croceivirga thetidis]
MSSRKTGRYIVALLLVVASILSSSAVTSKSILNYFSDIDSERLLESRKTDYQKTKSTTTDLEHSTNAANSGLFFTTIIQNADEEAICPNDGSTLAKFFLCGTSDVRTLSLNSSGGSYEWQQLDTNTCAPSVVEDCPTINTSCTWNTVGTDPTYDLSDPGEYRVRIGGGQFYYFKASQNPLDPQLVYEDIICGNPGRVEVTNVPNGYEYSLNSPTGPFQTDPFFDINVAGDYTVYVRLQNVASSACLFPSETVAIQELDIDVQVTKTDILCAGEQGSVSVNVNGVPGFYTYRLIKDGVTVDTFGPNGSDNYTFPSVVSGDYSVRVSTNDCDITVTNDVNGDPISIGGGIAPLDVSATASDSFGCGATSVNVTVSTDGGTAPYRFSVDGGALGSTYTNSLDFSVTTSGTYAILVEDANGCQRSASVDVVDIPPPVFNVSAQDANCGGANNGQVTVNLTNGFGYNIEYSIDNGISYQVSNVFSGLAPGSYDVMLRYTQDSFTCTTPSQTVAVGTPTTITAIANADSNPSCSNENGGQISITGVSGGTAPYEFSIGAGFSATSVFSNLSVGNYTPQIRDANGCVQTLTTINFAALDRPSDLDFSISSLDCIATTATVTLTETGGTGPYTYEIIAPASVALNNGGNNSFSGLGLGSYTFRVTDTFGCSYDENYAITDISSIRVQTQQLSPVSCFGNSDGEGRFIVDSFNTTYGYSIDGGTTFTGQTNPTIDINGLAAGAYTIVVTDEETSCTDSITLTVEGPPSPFSLDSLSVDPMDCLNGNIGAVTANTSGGWGGESFSVIQPDGSTRGPQNSPVFSGLSQSGTYTVNVTDLNGCTQSDTFTLTALDAPVLTVDTAASDFCYDAFDAATIVVNGTLGAAPYQYRLNNGVFGASNSFGGLTPGTYDIEVADAKDCRDTLTLTIAPQINASASITQELECSGPSGEIQVVIFDGYPAGSSYDSWEVSINGGPFTTDDNPIVGNTFTYSVPNDGSITARTSFRFEVTDSQGCTNVTNTVLISPQQTISGTATATDTFCGDNTSGTVTLQPNLAQGIPPFEFSNDGGTTFGSQNVFSGYGPGTYNDFVIRDSRGCLSNLISATIGTSLPVNATLTPTPAICAASVVEGSITVDVTDATAPYNFTLLDVGGNVVASIGPTTSTTVNFPNLPQGDYTVVTTDANGCEDRDATEVDQNQLNLTPLDTPPANCSDPFLSYRVQASGGTAPYEFRLVGDPTFVLANVNGIDIHDFSAVVTFGVTYFVEVRDALGCIYEEEIPPITPPSPIAVAATGTTTSCGTAATGEVFYEITGIASPADFTVTVEDVDSGTIISGPTTFNNEPIPYNGTISGLPPGNYQVIVNDLNTACNASAIALITEENPTILVEGNIPATCNSGALVTVRGSGGTPSYGYAYVPTGTGAPTSFASNGTFDIPGPYPADYDFFVQDANGCQSITTVTVTESTGVPNPTINVVNQCTATSGFQITITAPLNTGSGLPEETFQYDFGGGYQNSPNFTAPNAGTYSITVRDGNGCINTVNADVFDFFAITARASTEPTCNGTDGEITVNTTGGSGNFEFQLRDAVTLLPIGTTQNTNIFTGIAPGDYSILVTDLASNTVPLCSDVAVVSVTTVANPIISATPSTAISCNGANDGTISVELQPGTDTDTPIEYNLYDGATATILAGPQSTSLFDNLGPGTYQVEAVTFRGCTDRSTDIIITEPSALQLNIANSDFVCNPSNNQFSTATITAFIDTNGDGSGIATGTGPYTYSINDGTPAFDGTNFQTNNTFTIIDNGTNQNITITARDQNGCEFSSAITINAPSDLTFSFNVSPISCDATGAGVDPGSIDIIVDQGSGNYEVELLPLGSEPARNSGGTDRVNWPISVPGDYIFAVTDLTSGSCIYLTSIVNVPEFNTIDATIAEVRPVSCFGGNDGEISLDISNYSGLYNYEVFSRDNTGVETSTGVTGSFDTNAPINSPEIIGGLPAGNMIVYIEAMDAPFCDVTSNVATIRSPDRALTVTVTQTAEVTCATPGLGEITVAGDGGWGSYEYQLVAPDGVTILVDYPNTDAIFSNLNDGSYTVNTRDINGCEVSETITLSFPTPIYADIQVVNPLLCNNDNNGSIEAFNISGGQGVGNYLFQLNRLTDGSDSGLQTTPTFNNLSAGDYTITVFDGWNCSYITVPITVQDPEIVEAELVELQPPGCGDLGRMELTVTNPELGVDYFYRRSGTTDAFQPFGAGLVSVEITADVNIDPGPFQYDVQNSNGCPFERSNQISLDAAAPLVIDLDLTNATINCAGESTGIIRSEAFGGIGNYRYTLLNSDTPPNPTTTNTVRNEQDSGIFRNLAAGTYFVYARSGGCEAISPPIVIEPRPPLVLEYLETQSPTCFGETDGQVVLEASGGTGRIRYSISDNLSEFFEGNDPTNPNRRIFEDLAPRQYDIIIQDELGCTITRTITITAPEELVASMASSTPETCLGDADGTVTLNITGGTAPYFTSINTNDPANFERNDSMFFEGLPGGETLVIFIRDAAGCETNVAVEIGIGVDLIAESIVQYGCEGIFPNNTTAIELTNDALRGEVLFSLDVDDISLATEQSVWGDLPAGEHIVYVYHKNGCVTFTEFEIKEYLPLTADFGQVSPNEISVIAFGGFGDYEYFFNGESYGNDNVYIPLESQTIQVEVHDRLGCVVNLMIPYEFNEMPQLPDFFTPDGDVMNEEWRVENSQFFPNIEVKIYDRYGRVVANLKDVEGWDGRYEGAELPTGDYWYVVNANDKRNQRWVGHFTLYR